MINQLVHTSESTSRVSNDDGEDRVRVWGSADLESNSPARPIVDLRAAKHSYILKDKSTECRRVDDIPEPCELIGSQLRS